MLCPVSRPVTTLDCVLLKDNNRALVATSEPEINSQACLCVLQDHATMPDAVSPSSVSSFFIYSAIANETERQFEKFKTIKLHVCVVVTGTKF